MFRHFGDDDRVRKVLKKIAVHIAFSVLCLMMLTACSPGEAPSPNSSPQETLVEGSGEDGVVFPGETMTEEEASQWVMAHLSALIYQEPSDQYLSLRGLSPEAMALQSDAVIYDSAYELLRECWVEYPQEDLVDLAVSVVKKLYGNALCQVVSTQVTEEGDVLLLLSLVPVTLATVVHEEVLEMQFDQVTEGVKMSQVSQEDYELYDDIYGTKILGEIFHGEPLYGSPQEFTIKLQKTTQGYLLEQKSWGEFQKALIDYG